MVDFTDYGRAHPDPDALFKKLGEDFGIHKDVIRYMLRTCEMKSIHDFRYYFTNDAAVEDMVHRVRASGHVDDPNYLNKGLNISRVRQALDGVRRELSKRERGSEAVDTADLDEPLPAQDLKNLKKAHWKRYKAHYPAHVMCADVLISRVSRELSKRSLQVQAFSNVRTLTHQVTSVKKKRKVGNDLYTNDVPDLNLSLDYDGYLNQMFTYMIALSIAGCINRANPPPGGETMESISTLFVEIPMDLLMKYYFRAKHSSQQQPLSRRFSWLQEKDIAERSEWAEEYNKSEAPLGEVIRHVMLKRDAHWYPPILHTNDTEALRNEIKKQASKQLALENRIAKQTRDGRKGGGVPPGGGGAGSLNTSPGGKGTPPGKQGGGGGGGGSPPPGSAKLFGHPVAFKMKDGQKLCRAFQKGECKNVVDDAGKGCKDGLHKCAVLTNREGTRVCGGNHAAKDHKHR